MRKAMTRRSYGARIERVVAHVHAHLDEDLPLDRLAEVACFSPYHFHRIYRGLMGETVAETVTRMRLERAAHDLVALDRPIAALARRAGYGSAAAFGRAFRAWTGETPGQWRRRGGTISPTSPNPGNLGRLPVIHVEIRDFAAVRCAALAHAGPYIAIGATFQRLAAWAAGRGMTEAGRRSFGVYYDDPAAVPASKLRSAACLELAPEDTVDGNAETLVIPAGRHAVLRHVGPYPELETAYRSLYGEWLPSSGMVAADLPCFEEYLNDPRDVPPQRLITEIHLPLA